MGNGALPNGPSYRAHPRLYHGKQCVFAKRSGITRIAELIGHKQGFTLSFYAPMQLPVPALKELIEPAKYSGLRLNYVHGLRPAPILGRAPTTAGRSKGRLPRTWPLRS
jgi:hypothetical protein